MSRLGMLLLLPLLLSASFWICKMRFLDAAALLPALPVLASPANRWTADYNVCIVKACGTNDSAPAIIDAFERCGHNAGHHRGKVIFGNETYHIKSVMNTTGLSNVDIELHGTLLWDTNIPYWLNHSLAVGYQNQSSAWLFGGDNVRWDGFGVGTLDGNGQVW